MQRYGICSVCRVVDSAETQAALAVEGEFARAVTALAGLREEVAGIASATERTLSAEPPALALLEWWASHTDACHTAYRGFMHADAGASYSCCRFDELPV